MGKASDENLPVCELREYLRYDPDSGNLYWLERSASMFGHTSNPEAQCKKFNMRFSGAEALTTDCGKGYRVGKVAQVIVKAHRVCWALHSGGWPDGDVYHKNGDRKDNRAKNLAMRNVVEFDLDL